MASPPPYPVPSVPNPRKRPSLSTMSTTTSSKKLKLEHPLRQYSLPLTHSSTAYTSAGSPSARSETGSLVNSVFSGTSTTKPAPRGRGRPRKSATFNDADLQNHGNETSYQVAGSTTRGKHTRSVVSASANEADNDEDDAEDMAAAVGSLAKDEDEERRAQQRQDLLKEALDREQYNRFERWRTSRLSGGMIKKMVNQTVSQSVSETPLHAMALHTKWFVAEIVERAREVQLEWAEAYEATRDKEKAERESQVQALQDQLKADEAKADNERLSEYDRRRLLARSEQARKLAGQYIPNPHKAGLLPDHLREALRRYKADGEGAGVGLDGLSHPLLESRGSRIWNNGDGSLGKRLFR